MRRVTGVNCWSGSSSNSLTAVARSSRLDPNGQCHRGCRSRSTLGQNVAGARDDANEHHRAGATRLAYVANHET